MIDCNGESPGENAGTMDTVSLVMAAETFGEFSPLLQRGVNLPAMVPCALGDFLHEQLGLGIEYISERITTIFVDGKTTDSLEETVVRDRSIIALSAAMPGVVGATFRRGSYYAAMRSAITSMEKENAGPCEEGVVSVKLFNLLLTDLGPEFLKKGILMTASDLSPLLIRMSGSFPEGCREAWVNGRSVDPESLRHMARLLNHDTVSLTIRFI